MGKYKCVWDSIRTYIFHSYVERTIVELHWSKPLLVYWPIDLVAFMSFMICVGSFVDGRGAFRLFRLFRSFAYGHFAALSLVAIFHAPLMALSTLAEPTNSRTHESTHTHTCIHTHTG